MSTSVPGISRREAFKTAGAGILTATALAALMESGCAVPNWVQTIINDIPTVLQIVLQIYNIVGLYSSKGVDPTVVSKAQQIATEIQNDLKNIQNWVGQYQAGTHGVLSDIYNALTVVQNNLTGILATLHVYSNEYTAAFGIAVTSALAVITAIQNIVPVPSPTPASLTAERSMARGAIQTNQAPTIKLFYNEAMIAAGGSNFAIA